MNTNEFNNLKTWEKEMWHKAREARSNPQYKHDLVYLYIELEQISKKYLSNNQLQEGDFFDVPLENGTIFRMSFYKKYSTVDIGHKKIEHKNQFNTLEELRAYQQIEDKDKPRQTIWHNVITKEDSYKKEYIELRGYSKALQDTGLGIGYKYPQSLVTHLQYMKPGDTLIFNNGRMYTLEENHISGCSLSSVCTNPKNPKLKDFQKRQFTNLEFSNVEDMQNFYNSVCDNMTYGVIGKYSISTHAQQQINALYAGMEQNSVKVLQFGDIHLHAHKNTFHKGFTWYDNHGSKVSEDTVKTMLSWYSNAPVITEYKTPNNNFLREFNNVQVQSIIEDNYKEKNFKNIYNILSSYALLNHQSLSIQISTYKQTEDNTYEAVSVVFGEHNGKTQIGIVTYDKGNPSNEINSYKTMNIDEFEHFCTEVFQNMVIFSRNEIIKENIEKHYPDFPNMDNSTIQKIVNHAAELRTNKNFINSLQFTTLNEHNESLIQSYFDNYSEEERI